MNSSSRPKKAAVALCFLAFAVFIALSNHYDWDHFFSFLEVERRSWLLDHTPPLWSYQLCAGATRIGDPQSFGLSPLLLPVIAFGSFFGAKAIVILSAWVGYLYLKRLLLLLDPRRDEGVATALALTFVFSGYFLWHFHVGHLTFALCYWLIPPAYFLVRALSGERAGRGERWIHFLSVFCLCSGGFYHAFIFTAMPLAIALMVFAGVELLRQGTPRVTLSPAARGELWRWTAVSAAAVLLSCYKWTAVLAYHKEFPRSFIPPVPESKSLLQLVENALLPTWNRLFLGRIPVIDPFGVWECSNFSFAFIALPLALLLKGKTRGRTFAAGWTAGMLVILALCLGARSVVNLHGWINHALLKDSVRVIGRYQISLVAFALLAVHRLWVISPDLRRRATPALIWGAFAAAWLGMASFAPGLDWPLFREIASFKKADLREMRLMTPARPRGSDQSFMYRPVLSGELVPNCYQPLSRGPLRLSEFYVKARLKERMKGRSIPLASSPSGRLSRACADSVYATQSALAFDRNACPPDLCFNLNALNPRSLGGVRLCP